MLGGNIKTVHILILILNNPFIYAHSNMYDFLLAVVTDSNVLRIHLTVLVLSPTGIYTTATHSNFCIWDWGQTSCESDGR